MAERIAPTVVDIKHGETEHSHPAYGMLGVTRVTGRNFLYGADYEVSDYLIVRIATSTARRDLSRFWHSPKEQIVEVAISPAQWAAFVSSMNVGDGVCCTITRRGYSMVPGILPTEDEAELHGKEMSANLKNGVAALNELEASLDELKIPQKAKADLAFKIERARRSIGGTHDFIRNSFGEFVEKKTERMKANLHAYAESMLMGLGLKKAHEEIEAEARTQVIEDRRDDSVDDRSV